MWIEFPGAYSTKHGDIVILSDGVTETSHVVRDLSITAVDVKENIVTGMSGPLEEVILWSWEDALGGRVFATANNLGQWTGDFDDIGFDLIPGYHVRAEVWDDRNVTAVDLEIMYQVFLPTVMQIKVAGERIDIYESGSLSFPEKTPFHISHGWISEDVDEFFDMLEFKLQFDGVYLEESFIDIYFDQGRDPPAYLKNFVFNFPTGMTGVHIFQGHWLGPCSAFYDDCSVPYEIVEVGSSIVEVTFIP